MKMDMNMMTMTPVDDLPEAQSVKYPIGSQVKILATHMEGMEGAQGTIVGAYDCRAYAVDATSPAGKAFKNHKWVIDKEIKDGRGKNFQIGDRIVLSKGHVASMIGEGSQATIVEVHVPPVYMIDYQPADGGPIVKNHQWVVEDELKPLSS